MQKLFRDLDARRRIFAAGFLFVYILVFFVLNEKFEFIGPYLQLGLEVGLVILSLLAFRGDWFVEEKFRRRLLPQLALNLVLGYLIFQLALIWQLGIPFNWHENETKIWLLGWAPLVEEAIFRQVLFVSLWILIGRPAWVIGLSALLFAYSHARALWILGFDHPVSGFVIYQTIYTFLMALLWSHWRLRKRSFIGPWLMHLCFNAGFAVALAQYSPPAPLEDDNDAASLTPTPAHWVTLASRAASLRKLL